MTILLNCHIGRVVLGSMCVGDSVCLGWHGICVAGWRTCWTVELPHWLYCSVKVVLFCKHGGFSISVLTVMVFSALWLLCSHMCVCFIGWLVMLFFKCSMLLWIWDCTVHTLARCVLEFRCGWVGVVCWSTTVLQSATRIPLQNNYTETPTHLEPRTTRPMW